MNHRSKPFITALCCVALLIFASSASADSWLRCGQVLDVENGRLIGPMTVHVSDDRIEAMLDGAPTAPQDATVIDLSDLTCLPGLMDMHTHLTSESSPTRYTERFTKNEADVALQSTEYARKTLLAGFTTVRDLGDSFNASIALRNAINNGVIVGPRIYTSGKSLATTGGHADPTNGWRADLMGDPGPREGVLNGVAEARAAVRQRYKDGADLIKITATGGVLSVAKNGLNPQFSEEEMAAVIETSVHSRVNQPEVGALQHALRRWLWYSLRGSPVMRAE